MNTFANDFFGAAPTGHGGKRRGAGAKPKDEQESGAYADFNKARARKEIAVAGQEEIELAKQMGEVVLRSEIVDATTKAYAGIAQAMRAIPDNLERQLGLAPEVTEKMSILIDDALAELSDTLAKIHNETVEINEHPESD